MLQTERIQAMKAEVFKGNLDLPQAGLVKLTWGNVSLIDRELGMVVIKPSGVPYKAMKSEQMVVTDLAGNLLEENSLNPSSDLPTHLVLYRAFPEIQAIVHTHSTAAVKWAQAGRSIPAYGTTHADHFYGSVPCTRNLTASEIGNDYEIATGEVIIETFQEQVLDPLAVPGVIVNGHGPFTWGASVGKAVENSIVLEEISDMALATELLSPNVVPIADYLLDKHYFRKHGAKAYYGQKAIH